MPSHDPVQLHMPANPATTFHPDPGEALIFCLLSHSLLSLSNNL